MQRVSSRTIRLGIKYRLVLSSKSILPFNHIHTKESIAGASNLQPLHDSSKPFFSLSSPQMGFPHTRKESNPSQKNQSPSRFSTTTTNDEEENSMDGRILSISADRKRGFGFVCLENKPVIHTNQSCSDEYSADVEKVYRILRKFHSRVPKLELALQESGVVVRSGLVERVLNRCGDAGNLGYRFFAWASKRPGYKHSYEVYKSMIRILGKMRQFGAVWALIEEMRKENPQLITPDVFIVLMRRFASARMVQKAIEVLDETPKYGCEPDEHVFGCLLYTL